jgi:quercetin dioxygenase-like cupin family protein
VKDVVVTSSELDFRPLPGRSAADPFAGIDAGGLSMRVVYLDAGAKRSPHRHPHSYEAIYVVEGRGHIWENGSARRVSEGDCVLVAPGVPHATVPDQDAGMKLVCFWPHPDLASNIEEIAGQIHIHGSEG